MTSDSVYIGLNNVECPNTGCTHYSERAKSTQKEYDEEDLGIYDTNLVFGLFKPTGVVDD